jgi:hypothetical protein
MCAVTQAALASARKPKTHRGTECAAAPGQHDEDSGSGQESDDEADNEDEHDVEDCTDHSDAMEQVDKGTLACSSSIRIQGAFSSEVVSRSWVA